MITPNSITLGELINLKYCERFSTQKSPCNNILNPETVIPIQTVANQCTTYNRNKFHKCDTIRNFTYKSLLIVYH